MSKTLKKSPVIDNAILRGLPLIIKNGQIRLNGQISKGPNFVFKKVKVVPESLFRHDVIYDSDKHGLLTGESRRLTIVNVFNIKLNRSKTLAKFTDSVSIEERTSEGVTKLIGQKNYDTVLTGLCSVLDLEVKARSILALLTPSKAYSDKATATDTITDDSYDKVEHKYIKRRRMKKKMGPFVVKKDSKKKVVTKFIVYPEEIKSSCNQSKDKVNDDDEKKPSISRSSSCGNLSLLSGYTDQIPDDEETILKNIDCHTADPVDVNLNVNDIKLEDNKPILDSNCSDNTFNPTMIRLSNGTQVMLPMRPEDCFHIATPEILRNVFDSEQQKLMDLQALIDWALCLQRDEDNNLPIHLATINNDEDLLLRHCIMLRKKQEIVDVLGDENLTPLQISILHNATPGCTKLLLRYGADILLTDSEGRNALHLAALTDGSHLEIIVDYAKKNFRQILKENTDIWNDTYESKSDEELRRILLKYLSLQYDTQGNTPLTLASKHGQYKNVGLLAEMCPETINQQMPNSGNTALYEAIAAACIDSEERNNRSKISREFQDTITVLLKNKADPEIENYSGSNVFNVLSEINITQLSTILSTLLYQANVSYLNDPPKNCDSLILVKNEDKIKVESVNKKPVIKILNRKKTIVDKAKNILLADTKEKRAIVVNSKESPISVEKDVKILSCVNTKPVLLNKRKIVIGTVDGSKPKVIKVDTKE